MQVTQVTYSYRVYWFRLRKVRYMFRDMVMVRIVATVRPKKINRPVADGAGPM